MHNKMRKSILFLLIGLSIIGCRKQTIEVYNPSEIDGLNLTVQDPNVFGLQAIHFLDVKNGFACGYNGKVVKSIDGGYTWVELKTNTNLALFDIFFINKNKGFVVGEESTLMYTEDAGSNWQKISLDIPDKIEFKSIQFINDSIGFAIGYSSILKTTNGGLSWAQEKIDCLGGTMQKIDFDGTLNGMIICVGGKIVSTTDGGNTWYVNSSISVQGSVSISVTKNSVVYASGNSKVFKSTDFGNTWVELLNSPMDNFDLNFVNQNLGFAVGRGNYTGGDFGHSFGAISYTNDGGDSWVINKTITETGSFFQSSFPSENEGFIVSGNRIINVIKK